MPSPLCRDAIAVPSSLSGGLGGQGGGALPLAGLTILLVEDSRFASDTLRMMCQRSGARLRRAETMEQARAHLRTYWPDVVIVDLGLPDGRGDRLIRDLARSHSGFVVLGMSGDPDARAEALAAGAAGFVAKPLAGLGAYQRAILRHLPGRFAPTLCYDGVEGEGGDLLALQDDLAHAEGLLADGLDAAARGYVSRFVAGLARAVGDIALAEASEALARRADALPALRALVRDRLGKGAAF